MDMRMAGASVLPAASGTASGSSKDGGTAASYIVKTVQAHSNGGVSALVAHGNAPLLATGTTTQVVKVWTDQGEAVRSRARWGLYCFLCSLGWESRV